MPRHYHPKCHRSSGPATPRIGKMVNTQLPMSWAYADLVGQARIGIAVDLGLGISDHIQQCLGDGQRRRSGG